ncbi:MAG: rhomboid family intramembrane serine protease [Chitinophagia bacterium]|nr:rhomboid family intramembrane serine protease [Chitinophagia bacterium]
MYGLYMFGGIIEERLGPQRFLIFYLVCGIGAALCQLGVYTYEFTTFHNQITQFRNTPDLQHFSWLVHNNNELKGSPVMQQILHFWSTHNDCSNCQGEAMAQLQAADNALRSNVMESTLVGASGAVFGVLFAFAYYFPNIELYIMFIPIPIKAKWAVAGYAVIELWSGFGRFSGDNVAHFAHLGGMLFAFLLLWLWRHKIHNRYY